MKAYLEAQVKTYKVENLKTGDLVKLRADIMPIIYHYGVILRNGDEILIAHFQSDYFNSNGGSLVIEDFRNYIKGRNLVGVKTTNLKASQISKIIESLKSKRYHFVNSNCEHFISLISEKKHESKQVKTWAIGLTTVLLLVLLLKKKK